MDEGRMEGMQDMYNDIVDNDDTVIRIEAIPDMIMDIISRLEDREVLRNIHDLIEHRLREEKEDD